ncbi:MAG: hypothetical protein ACE5LC_04855 [Candidatus Aminicenantales bacterium]
MKRLNPSLLMLVAAVIFGLLISQAWVKKEPEAQEREAEHQLPAAVAKAVDDNFPGAEIKNVEVGEEAGIKLYDIEFKAGKGEIEVAEDGTVIDLTTIVTIEDIPEAAAEAIQKAAEGATINQLEKAEVRAEIEKKEERGNIVKLEVPRYVYEAELVKGDLRGEIEVAADGKIIEPLKWEQKEY